MISAKSNMQKSDGLRQSNIELLRIIAMIFIVAHHFAVHSGFAFSVNSITVNRLWIQFIQIGGKIGVNIFVIISGYFLIMSQSIKTNKVIKLWSRIFFYSVIVFIVFVSFGAEQFSVKELIKHVLPITFTQWWFASTYFVLYMLSPYLNRLLRTFNNKQYICFLGLLFIGWCIIPTFTGKGFQSNELLWFCFLYAFAAYFRLFGIKNDFSASKLISLSFICTIIAFLSAVVFDVLGMKVPSISTHATFFYDMQDLPILAAAILLFLGFSKIKIHNNKTINTVSSATFGVYLIHDSNLIRPFLWKTVFMGASYANSSIMIPYSLLVIVIVYAGCILLELLRQYTLETKYFNKMVTCFSKIIDYVIALLTNKIMNFLSK